MKKIALLGSTGSVGQQTLEVVRHLGKENFQVVALAAGSDSEALKAQVDEFTPEVFALYNKESALNFPGALSGMEGIVACAIETDADLVVSAISGTSGILPTLRAIESGKDVALANKEALVSAGALLIKAAQRTGACLLPVDSEHSAIFQCLRGEDPKTISRLILTASGGPFRTFSKDDLQKITLDSALKHPTWKMGAKVTIDSSTLMNKGLEVIEAHWLFSIPLEQIDVVIHPQSIIHSMVEFIDGSMMAQMSSPSMIVPIQYALTYPKRQEGIIPPFDFTKNGRLEFSSPDMDRFRCLNLAFSALREGGTMPCFMNAANESLVHRFLNREISWLQIGQKLECLMERHIACPLESIDELLLIDSLAREVANKA